MNATADARAYLGRLLPRSTSSKAVGAASAAPLGAAASSGQEKGALGSNGHGSGNGSAASAGSDADGDGDGVQKSPTQGEAAAAALERRWPWKKRGLSVRERYETASKLVTMLSYLATEEDGM